MALAININVLLNKQKMNPIALSSRKVGIEAAYISICAFANDIDDLGGGYIISLE